MDRSRSRDHRSSPRHLVALLGALDLGATADMAYRPGNSYSPRILAIRRVPTPPWTYRQSAIQERNQMNEDEDLRFYQEVQQYRELRDFDYESWSELLDGEYWSMWYDFVEKGEPSDGFLERMGAGRDYEPSLLLPI